MRLAGLPVIAVRIAAASSWGDLSLEPNLKSDIPSIRRKESPA